MRTLALRRCARVLRSKPRHGHVLRLRGRVGQRRTGSTDRDGSDPPVQGPGTGSDAGVFSHLCPRPLGSLPIHQSLRGKAVQRRFEAADHPFADRPAVWQPGITEQGRGTPDGSGHSPSRQVRDAPVLGDRGATAKQPATYATDPRRSAVQFRPPNRSRSPLRKTTSNRGSELASREASGSAGQGLGPAFGSSPSWAEQAAQRP